MYDYERAESAKVPGRLNRRKAGLLVHLVQCRGGVHKVRVEKGTIQPPLHVTPYAR